MRLPRATLVSVVKTMFVLFALAFVFVLFRSLAGPSLSSAVATPFDDVQLGETALRRYQQDRVWVTRLTPQLRRQLLSLSEFVELEGDACDVQAELCILSAATNRSGVEVRYTANAPKRFSNKLPWFGGFVDPSSGTVFDRLGRAYKNQNGRQGLTQVVVPGLSRTK